MLHANAQKELMQVDRLIMGTHPEAFAMLAGSCMQAFGMSSVGQALSHGEGLVQVMMPHLGCNEQVPPKEGVRP